MKARYQYRIYPTSNQQRALARLFGCVRTVWNDSLALCKYDGIVKTSVLQKVFITLAKQTESRKWLSEVSNIALQQSVADLGVAYKNFFAGIKAGRKIGYPKFKRRSNQQSARFTRGGFSLKKGKVYLAKIGLLKTKWSRELPSVPSSVTVIKDNLARYFLSFVVEVETIAEPASRESIGADLGIKIFAALSNGEKVYAPDYSKLDRKIRRFQRSFARQSRGSNRREGSRLKIAKLQAKITAIRKDFLHKLSTRLIRANQIVSLEDLNVSSMVKNRKLARAISQCGWSAFRVMCEAKADRYLRDVRVIDRWQPTSQICSSCGYKWGKLDLALRQIVCIECGDSHCRDENAAKNIDHVGGGHRHDNKWTGRERKTAVAAISVELSTHKLGEQLCLF